MWTVSPSPHSGIARERCRALSWLLMDLGAALFVMTFVVGTLVGAILTGTGLVSDRTWDLVAGHPTQGSAIVSGLLLVAGLYVSVLGDRFERRRRRRAACLEEEEQDR